MFTRTTWRRAWPVNKRLFHLVYRRSTHSGEMSGSGPLQDQVLNVARDLHNQALEFIAHVEGSVSKELARTALNNALVEAQKAADHYRIANPLV